MTAIHPPKDAGVAEDEARLGGRRGRDRVAAYRAEGRGGGGRGGTVWMGRWVRVEIGGVGRWLGFMMVEEGRGAVALGGELVG